MPPNPSPARSLPRTGIVLGGMLAAIMALVLLVAPEEESMGQVQRIVYLHVAVAWFALAGFLAAAACGLLYLWRRELRWDHWAQAAAEVGWLCCTSTLLTGSIWAHEAWNTWWTWDPRLTTSLILWTIYAGYFVVRANFQARDQRARTSAVLALVGAADIPLIVMATRWFRGLHPSAPEMEPLMRWVLLASVATLTAFLAWLVARRREQIDLAARVDDLEQRLAA